MRYFLLIEMQQKTMFSKCMLRLSISYQSSKNSLCARNCNKIRLLSVLSSGNVDVESASKEPLSFYYRRRKSKMDGPFVKNLFLGKFDRV